MRGLFDGLNHFFFQDSAYRTRFNTDISGWDITNVTDMSNMFRANGSFNRDITGWDVSNVTNMSGMFAEAIAFNQPIGMWDVSNVTDMSDMFANARGFNQPLGAWDVSNVTDMSGLFDSWLAEDIGPSPYYWGAVPFNQDLSSWDVGNVTDMSRMFRWGRFTQPINMGDTSNVTDMSRMFERHETYNQPLNGLDVSKVTTMRRMFAGCDLIQSRQITLCKFNSTDVSASDRHLLGWKRSLPIGSTKMPPPRPSTKSLIFAVGNSNLYLPPVLLFTALKMTVLPSISKMDAG
jgi:surface protein